MGLDKVMGVTSKMAKFISEEVHSPIDSCRHLYDTEVRFLRPLLEEDNFKQCAY